MSHPFLNMAHELHHDWFTGKLQQAFNACDNVNWNVLPQPYFEVQPGNRPAYILNLTPIVEIKDIERSCFTDFVEYNKIQTILKDIYLSDVYSKRFNQHYRELLLAKQAANALGHNGLICFQMIPFSLKDGQWDVSDPKLIEYMNAYRDLLHAHLGNETVITVDLKGGITEDGRSNDQCGGLGQFGFTETESWTSKALELIDGSLIEMRSYENKHLVRTSNQYS